MSAWRSSENQRSFTAFTSRSLPKVPRGMVAVMREPRTETPFMAAGGRSSFTAGGPFIENDARFPLSAIITKLPDEPIEI